MCGFAGVLVDGLSDTLSISKLQSMGDSIAHRGPDGQGIYISPSNHVGIVHRRLAIVDLSSAGHQPMASSDERYVIAFNGEIYNHDDLRRDLEDCFDSQWRGHSDTETLLEGIRCWGLEKTISYCVGMFAFALWDTVDLTLTLVRDRAGEKPLYYGFCNGSFLFGSELKALKTHSAFDSRINLDAIALFMRHKYIPAPHTIYSNIYKLMPGSILTLDADRIHSSLNIKEYWSFGHAAQLASKSPFIGNDLEALSAIENQLMLSVKQQMLADVPLGAFLSGGTDSSLIASLMQKQSDKPIRTFTIGFEVAEYNEAQHAKSVAKYLGTDHTEIYVGESDSLDVVPKLSSMFDEPFADSSQIPTYIIASEARKHVTVALSGDAGDELFCGYTRYFRCLSKSQHVSLLPDRFFGLLRSITPLLNSDVWQQIDSLTRQKNNGTWSNMFQRMSDFSDLNEFSELYRYMVSDWKKPTNLLKGRGEAISLFNPAKIDGRQDKFNWMMLTDSVTYLPDDVLVKVDRAAMAASLETRVPMLDHRFIELALSMPLDVKVRENTGKWALKQILYKNVPKEILDRPKVGFGVPIDSWLRGPLKDWAEDLLNEHKLSQQGLFNTKLVRKYWSEHLSNCRNWQYPLWNILMFQSWLQENES